MSEIQDLQELRFDYTFVRFAEADADAGASEGALKRLVDEYKRKIRRYGKRPQRIGPYEATVEILRDNGIDGYVERIEIPLAQSIRTGERIFDEYIFLPDPHSAYDCTGKLFTCWHKVILRCGHCFIFHGVSRDV